MTNILTKISNTKLEGTEGRQVHRLCQACVDTYGKGLSIAYIGLGVFNPLYCCELCDTSCQRRFYRCSSVAYDTLVSRHEKGNTQ